MFTTIFLAVLAAKFISFCGSVCVRVIDRYIKKAQEPRRWWEARRYQNIFQKLNDKELEELKKQRSDFKYWKDSKNRMF